MSLCQESLSHFDDSTSSSPMAAASAVILPHHCSKLCMSALHRMKRRSCSSRQVLNSHRATGQTCPTEEEHKRECARLCIAAVQDISTSPATLSLAFGSSSSCASASQAATGLGGVVLPMVWASKPAETATCLSLSLQIRCVVCCMSRFTGEQSQTRSCNGLTKH